MTDMSEKALKACIKEEVLASFSKKELTLIPDFEAFFILVDAQNGYEPNWESKRDSLKPLYEKVWNELTKR